MVSVDRDAEVLIEGYRSYHRAVFAIAEFRRQVAKQIWMSVQPRLPEIAEAMGLSEELLKSGTEYGEPDRISKEFDGEEAEIGFRIPKNWKHPWHVFFYLWTGEDEEGSQSKFIVQVNFWSNDGALDSMRSAAEKLNRIDLGFFTEEKVAWLAQGVTGVGSTTLSSVIGRVIDKWITLWRTVETCPFEIAPPVK
jgi:hypothetical protein